MLALRDEKTAAKSVPEVTSPRLSSVCGAPSSSLHVAYSMSPIPVGDGKSPWQSCVHGS